MTVRRRLAKLEELLPSTRGVERTKEEQGVLVYEMAFALVRAGKIPALQERLVACVNRIAAQIRSKAALPYTDVYRDHIRYVEEMWIGSGRTLPFVPPVLGSDYDEWFLPGLVERRLAIRRRSSVISLIGDTIASSSRWHTGVSEDEAQQHG